MKREKSELVEAAEGVESELERFDGIAAEVLRAPLDSQKGLERAAQLLRSVVAAEERVAAQVSDLVAAVGRARGRHQERAVAVEERAHQIETRGKQYAKLMEDFAAIGGDAGRVTQGLVAVATAPVAEREAALAGAHDAVGALSERAKDLAARALEDGFADVSRQAEGLRQQLLAGLNKIKLSFS